MYNILIQHKFFANGDSFCQRIGQVKGWNEAQDFAVNFIKKHPYLTGAIVVKKENKTFLDLVKWVVEWLK